MPSSNKTSKLKLNSWIETDRPTRSDFVQDNNIIDNYLGTHIENMGMHVTADEKTRVSTPYSIKSFQGTGESLRTLSLDFIPQIVIYFALDCAQSEFKSNNNYVNYGIAVKNIGGSIGCSLSGNNLIVRQGLNNGVYCNLNNGDCQYCVIAFR